MTFVDVDGLSSDGDGVGRLSDGRVVFVPSTFPGDRVSIRVNQSKKTVAHGEVIEILIPSSERRDSQCQRERCGGCVWRELDVTAQRTAKRDRVVQTLRRIGSVELDSEPEPESVGQGWGYRHRVRLHEHYADDYWQLGFYARKSHELVQLVRCPVLWPELERSCLEIAQMIRDLPHECQLRDIDVVFSRRDSRCAALIRCSGPLTAIRARYERTEMSFGIEVASAKERWSQGRLRLRYDHARAEEYTMLFEPSSFTQAHPELNDALVAAVSEAVRPATAPRVLELHAGIGNFTVALARGGAEVTAIEHNKRAVILNRRNASNAVARVNVFALPDRETETHLRDCDVVVLDPPRTGAKKASEMLAASRVSRVVYVSCDPATLARDVGTLVSGGFSVERVRIFDMFSQTPHVESLVVLGR